MFVFALIVEPLYQYKIVLNGKGSVIHAKNLVGIVLLRLCLPVYPVPVLVVFLYFEPLLYCIWTLGTERAVHFCGDDIEDKLPAYRVLGVVGKEFQEALASQNEQFFQSAVGIHLMYQRAIHSKFLSPAFAVVEGVADVVVLVFVVK